jgi:hypothetical protein
LKLLLAAASLYFLAHICCSSNGTILSYSFRAAFGQHIAAFVHVVVF